MATDNTGLMAQVMAFLNSPAGAAAISAGGGAASAYGQAKQAESQQAQNASQFAANTLGQQSRDDRSNASNAMTPLGENQTFAQKNALLSAILPGLRNQHSTPGDPAVAAAMGQRTGGFQLPEGGLDPAMIQAKFGDTPTLESLTQHAKQLSAVNPNAPQENFANLGFSQGQADPFMNNVSAYQGQQKGQQTDQRALIQRALDNDLTGEKQKQAQDDGSGFWHGLAKIAGPAAGIASMFIPGLQPLGAALLAGGGGALSALGSGGGAKGALLGGALGAATGAAGAKIKTGNYGTGYTPAPNRFS